MVLSGLLVVRVAHAHSRLNMAESAHVITGRYVGPQHLQEGCLEVLKLARHNQRRTESHWHGGRLGVTVGQTEGVNRLGRGKQYGSSLTKATVLLTTPGSENLTGQEPSRVRAHVVVAVA